MMMKAIRSLGYRFLDTALVRKPHLFLVLVVFLLSSLFQGLVMYWQPARADEPVERVNLVAVLVDNKIYKDIQADVERYTRDYIQQQLSNTKALVFPIDVKIFTPAKIAKILENLYFEGEVDKVSSLQ